MSEKSARDKALGKIASLKRLAEHPNTPPAESEAARGRIKALQDKHGISATQTKPKEPLTGLGDVFQREYEASRRAGEAARKAEQDRQAARAKAQEAYRQRMAGRDHYGRPIPNIDDLMDEAVKNDGRTAQDRNRDINDSWGSRDRYGPMPSRPSPSRCKKPESFFDSGGNPRKRNQYVMECSQCGCRLQPGEGSIAQVAGKWVAWCCESRPGPRKKRF